MGLTLFKGLYTTAVGPMMAMALLLIIPMVIIFFFAQKQMIQGVVMTGIKA